VHQNEKTGFEKSPFLISQLLLLDTKYIYMQNYSRFFFYFLNAEANCCLINVYMLSETRASIPL